MPNIIDENGLQVKTMQELVDDFTSGMEAIYGTDINLDQDTPDGQQMMIFNQAIIDVLDLIVGVNKSFDPDEATGRILDARVGINGIQRQGATFTIQPIEITTSQSVTLYGLDQNIEEVYTVSDDEGNNFLLLTTQVLGASTTTALQFRAEEPGAVLTLPNTITKQVTIVLGVTAVNNPSIASTQGENEESDQDLKIRRQKSVSISAVGYLSSLEALLNNITGVTDALVEENDTNDINQYGMVPHSIWVIIEGVADPALIAEAIYIKRHSGATMMGSQAFNYVRPNGSTITIRWDNVETEPIYIEFTATSIDGITPIKVSNIKSAIQSNLITQIFQTVTINDIVKVASNADPNALITNVGLSKDSGGPFNPTVTNTSLNFKFSVDQDDINITTVP